MSSLLRIRRIRQHAYAASPLTGHNCYPFFAFPFPFISKKWVLTNCGHGYGSLIWSCVTINSALTNCGGGHVTSPLTCHNCCPPDAFAWASALHPAGSYESRRWIASSPWTCVSVVSAPVHPMLLLRIDLRSVEGQSAPSPANPILLLQIGLRSAEGQSAPASSESFCFLPDILRSAEGCPAPTTRAYESKDKVAGRIASLWRVFGLPSSRHSLADSSPGALAGRQAKSGRLRSVFAPLVCKSSFVW